MSNTWRTDEPRPIPSRLVVWATLSFLIGVPVALELIAVARGG